jgi:hypothetical protein
MRNLPRALMLASALTMAGLTGGCYYSRTVEKTPSDGRDYDSGFDVHNDHHDVIQRPS